MSEKKEDACCTMCQGACIGGKNGWKWSLFTLAMLIVAGVATSTVFAGTEGTCPMSGAKACCAASGQTQHSGEAAAKCPAGEKEADKAAACTKSQSSCCEGKQAAADKAACNKDAKSCEKSKDAKPEEKK